MFEAEPAGESKGEAVAEAADEETAESVVMFRLRTGFWGRAVEAMLTAYGGVWQGETGGEGTERVLWRSARW